MGYKRRTHDEVAALAAAQHGVVSAAQLQDRGFSRKSIAAEAAGCRWQRLHRGVYAVGHEELSARGRCTAALLACEPAVASHWTAAWLWGLSASPSTFHFTAPSRRRPRQGDFVVHFAALSPEDVKEVDGIPVTSLARTHLDIAVNSPRHLPWMLERSEDLKKLDLRSFESLLARVGRHPGHGALTKALHIYRSDPDPATVRSRLERKFRRMLGSVGIPLPAANFIVGPYELDCYWEAERFCVELDTYGTHGSRRSFEEDRKRQRELRRLGIELERVTDKQLESEPAEVLAAVADRLARRQRQRD